jgi:signal peptidase I
VQSLFQLLIMVLSWLAVPVVVVYAYDKWVLEPKRPRTPEGEPEPGPLYTRIAGNLLPFVLIAAVLAIGVKEVFDWAGEVAVPLSWVSLPLGLWLAIDSWFLAPRRQIAAGSTQVPDPPLLRAAYWVLPVFVVAPIIRMIRAETLDFSLVLLVLSLATGLVWGLDHWVFRPRREAAAGLAKPPVALGEPGTVDYARSFFPVAFIVLIVRAFIFEPFRIPSDSMMPTLLDGDFIVVNKFAYGLRLPVVNEKFIDTGSPQRGDVVVFRYPPNPSINYIKRLVGLPGDRIEVHDDRLIINGESIPLQDEGRFTDGCYVGLKLSKETIGTHTHEVMSCRSPHGLLGARGFSFSGNPDPLPACDRKKVAEDIGGWVCDESTAAGSRDAHDYVFDVIPPGHYVMIGDNRDNSEDSRAWGLVPDKNLVGKATRIWFNFDLQRSKVVNWSRIGQGIE